MSAAPNAAPPVAPERPRRLLRTFFGWLRKNLLAAAISAVVGAGIAYVVNVWMIAVKFEGIGDAAPPGSIAVGKGNGLAGGLFWALASTVGFGIIGYRRAVGGERFWRDVRSLPKVIRSLFTQDGRSARVHLLWGAAATLLASRLISPAISATLAVGLTAAVPSVFGRMISTFALRVWSAILSRVAPTRGRPAAGVVSMTVGIVGAAAALALAYVVDDRGTQLAMAGVCAALAIVLSRVSTPTSTLPLLVLLGGTIAAIALGADRALADDGGWLECGQSWGAWFKCEGSSDVLVRAGLLGAAPAAGFSAVGLFLGHVAGTAGTGLLGPGGPGGPLHPIHPPMPEYPRVIVRGTTIMIEVDPLTTIAAPLNPDGTVGEWTGVARPKPRPGQPADPDATGPETETLPDGSTRTVWPDGSVEIVAADGTHLTSFPDGSVQIVAPDGTITATALDGTVEVTRPDGTLERTAPDGLREIISPDGTYESIAPDGTVTRLGPDGLPIPEAPQPEPPAEPAPEPPAMPSGQEISGRLNHLNQEIMDPALYDRLLHLFERIKAHNGAFTPADLREMHGIEAAQDAIAAARLDQIKVEQAAFADQQMAILRNRNEAELRAELIQKQIQSEINRYEAYVRNKMDSLPLGQWDATERILDRLTLRTSPNAEDLDAVRRLAGAVFQTNTGASETAGAAAMSDAALAELGERAATNVRNTAFAAEAALMFPAGHLATAQLGAFYLGRNGIEGAVDGYAEGGWKGAAWGVASRTLPVNTLAAAYDATIGQVVDPGAEHGGAGSIFLGFVQDVGNVTQLRAGTQQIAGWIKSEGAAPGFLARLTGEAGAADDAGRVPSRGGMTPERAAQLDAQAAAEHAQGQALVGHWQDLQAELRGGNPRPDIFERIDKAGDKIMGDFHAKNIIKRLPIEEQGTYIKHVGVVNEIVDEDFVRRMNANGVRIGGRELTKKDWYDIRNALSTTAPMDRDLALNQRVERAIEQHLSKLPPGSDEAQHWQQQLLRVKRETAITINGEKVSPATLTELAEHHYGEAFETATGQTAVDALQEVTHRRAPVAYTDLNVLENKPRDFPFRPEHAEQTGSVTPVKAYLNERTMSAPAAITETARGTAKDISTKLQPLLESQGDHMSMEAYTRTLEIKGFLDQVGSGRIGPGTAELMAQQRFGTGVTGLAEQVGSNIEAAVKFRPPMQAVEQAMAPVAGGLDDVAAGLRTAAKDTVQQAGFGMSHSRPDMAPDAPKDGAANEETTT